LVQNEDKEVINSNPLYTSQNLEMYIDSQ